MNDVANLVSRNASDGHLVAKAVAQAGEQLGLKQSEVAKIIGVSAPQMSKINAGSKPITGKPMELALYLIRIFRSLDAITGGDIVSTHAWMRSQNSALGGVPVEQVKEAAGLVDAMNYLDAARAPL